ncbi:histidine kinase [Nonomuraea sp. NPDC050310]|uniref:sensor histidine kinase n=1 Tax=Nonomuraea sp. NPDC050310 TaxID=3154935 RepID=UPI003401BAE7
MATMVWVALPALTFLAGLLAARRRPSPPPAGSWPGEAAFAVLHTAALAGPYLRGGLTRDGARRSVRHVRRLLGADAVALVSTEAVLATDGPCGEDLLERARPAMLSGRPHVSGATVAVPLSVEGTVVGALAVSDAEAGGALVRAAVEVAGWIGGQLELAELDASRRRATEAEMRALRAEISPHFIYNALTTIASFVRTDPVRARDLLLDFADFARYALRRTRDFTTLADELTCVDRYLLLERARFGDRLRFSVQVAPEALPVPVPFLCLQPLVENAIKHGLGESLGTTRGGSVRVVVRDAGPEAHISVEDDGVGMEPERARRLLDGLAAQEGADGRTGIGLANVDVRLRQIYGPAYGLAVETAPGAGTKIKLRVPKTRHSSL